MPASVLALHLLDLETRYVHASDYVREEGDHVVVAHGHVGNNLLESDLLDRMVLVLLSAAVQLEA